MSCACDDYEVQNVHRYSRKSYSNPRDSQENEWNNISSKNVKNDVAGNCPRSSEDRAVDTACHCSPDPEGEITSILHKKCPVITLAHHQLQRLLDETDKHFYNHSQSYRSTQEIISLCKEAVVSQNTCHCLLILLAAIAFVVGTILGAASCGTRLGRFNSPILACIENRLTPDTYTNTEDKYRSII